MSKVKYSPELGFKIAIRVPEYAFNGVDFSLTNAKQRRTDNGLSAKTLYPDLSYRNTSPSRGHKNGCNVVPRITARI